MSIHSSTDIFLPKSLAPVQRPLVLKGYICSLITLEVGGTAETCMHVYGVTGPCTKYFTSA